MNNICATCRFGSFGHAAAERGECRRFAPKTSIGIVEPDVRYANPEMASWPGVLRNDTCGEYQADVDAPFAALTEIVRERIFGDGTVDCEQRVIDLCNVARQRFGIERPAA